MSRRLQMQMAALKIVDTLIDAGFVSCHEEPPDQPGASTMQVPVFGPATGRFPKKFLGMATVSAEVQPELVFVLKCDAALQAMLDAAMSSEIGNEPHEVKLGQATQRWPRADATVAPVAIKPAPVTQVTLPFEDTELSSLYSPPVDAPAEPLAATFDSMCNAIDKVMSPPVGWDAIEGDEPDPDPESSAEHIEDTPEPQPEQPLLIDAKTLAALIGRSPGQLTADAQKGVIPPPVRVGRARMWRRAEIETWVAAGCTVWVPEPVKLAPVPTELDGGYPEKVSDFDTEAGVDSA